MYLMQKRQLYQTSQKKTGLLMTNNVSSLRRINNEENLNSEITINSLTGDSPVRQTLKNLGNGIAKVFLWASSSIERSEA